MQPGIRDKRSDKILFQDLGAIFLQETIKRGLLMPSLVISFAHSDEGYRQDRPGCWRSSAGLQKALEEGAEKYLAGRPVKPVFRVYN